MRSGGREIRSTNLEEGLAVAPEPEDDDVALAGGIRVARMCAELAPAVFLMNLDDATAGLRTSLCEAGLPEEAAQLAITAFEAGARKEWLRIAGSARMTWGTG